MTRAPRRWSCVLAAAAALVLTHGAALATEEGGEAAAGPNWTGYLVVALITLGVPLLFLVAAQLNPSGGDEQEEELEPVVAGIGQGRAPVPRWLYAMYVIIPVWALFYILGSSRAELVQPSPPPAETEAPNGGAPQTPAPPAGPSTDIRLVAEDLRFTTSTITVPAGQELTVEFRNADPTTPHNFAVYNDRTLAETIFKGDLFPGVATRTHTFTVPAAGEYFFQCDVHPTTMTGTLRAV